MDASWLRGTLLVLFGYLLGSVPFGILVAKAFDRDVDLGRPVRGTSARRTSRARSERRGILTLALDAGKGSSPSRSPGSSWIVRLPLACPGRRAVFLGHIFPAYLRFKGGRASRSPWASCCSSPRDRLRHRGSLAAVLYFTRYVSLASLCAAVAFRRDGVPREVAALRNPRPHDVVPRDLHPPGEHPPPPLRPGEQVRASVRGVTLHRPRAPGAHGLCKHPPGRPSRPLLPHRLAPMDR